MLHPLGQVAPGEWNESAAALQAARAIDEIAGHEGKLTVNDIAARLDVPESHAERIINRLVKVMRYLSKDTNGKLVLTSKVSDARDKA